MTQTPTVEPRKTTLRLKTPRIEKKVEKNAEEKTGALARQAEQLVRSDDNMRRMQAEMDNLVSRKPGSR